MCGISVIFSKNNNIPLAKSLEFHKKINHRGPDHSDIAFRYNNKIKLLSEFNTNVEILTNVFVGHTRLSIIDKSSVSNQPMKDIKNRFIISFNGEIYNYKELKTELQSDGIAFKTNSDTEVLLNGFINYKYDFLKRLNGMFAFIVYDSLEHRLTVCRDRFGVKPLYFCKIEDKFYFFSEIKQIFGLMRLSINKKKIEYFLKYNLKDYDNQTLLENIYQVRPGYHITLDQDNFDITQKCWYDPKLALKNNDNHKDTSFKELMSDAVSIRLRSDVPVGTQLSGGIDSSIISYLAYKKQKDISFFSAVSKNLADNDGIHVDHFHNYFGTKPNKFFYDNISEEVLNDSLFFEQQDEPIISISYYLEFRLFKYISNYFPDTKVILNGHGPDELFGYKSDLERYNLSQKSINGFLKKNNLLFLLKLIYYKFMTILKKKNNSVFSHRGQLNFNEYLIDQFTKYNLPMQLMNTDKSSMAFGLEVRSPFLDYRVYEHALNIKYPLYHDGQPKNYLKNNFNNQLPDSILYRKDKVGFNIQNIMLRNIDEKIYSILKVDKEFIDILKYNNFYRKFKNDFRKKNYQFFFKWYSLNKWLKLNNIQID